MKIRKVKIAGIDCNRMRLVSHIRRVQKPCELTIHSDNVKSGTTRDQELRIDTSPLVTLNSSAISLAQSKPQLIALIRSMRSCVALAVGCSLAIAAVRASPLGCEVGGVQIRHQGAKYLFGRPHRAGSVYATCASRQLRCFEDTGIAHAPALKSKEIDCSLESLDERKQRRSLGVEINSEDDIWPNNTLWYRIDSGAFTDAQLAIITTAIDFYGDVDVNITLQECEPETLCDGKYASIEQDEDACYGYVGYVNDGEPQTINLGETCLEEGGVGSVVHELAHALGLYHEHTHPNREVIVLTDQDLPVSADNYAKKTSSKAALTAYDPASIMHYGRSAGLCFPKSYYPLKAFCDVEQTVNCIMPVEQHCNATRDNEIGQMAVLSAGDIYALRALYGSRDGLNSTVSNLAVPTVSVASSSSASASSEADDDDASTAGEADGESFTFSLDDSDASGSTGSVYEPGDVHTED